MHGCLSGGIRAADDVHGFALAGHRFGGSSPVINTCSLQWRNPRNVQGSPLNAHRQKQRVARNLRTVRKLQKPIRALRAETHRFLWREDLHAEAPRLRDRTPRQVQASEAGRKAEMVPNSRTKSGLATGGLGVAD